MSKRSVQFPFLYTGNYNIRCFSNQKPNELTIKNDKIFFKTDIINANQPIDYLAIYKGQFKISSSLLFGINNKNPIQIQNGQYVRTIYVNNIEIDLYKNEATLVCTKQVPFTFLYAVNDKNKIFKTPVIYNELCQKQKCDKVKVQSYGLPTFGKEINTYPFSQISQRINCMQSSVYRNRLLNSQQNLYAEMRRHPEKFPIISWVKQMNLTLAEQRNYSNLWYRQFGTSQALPVNDNFGGFYVVGSEVPYTN